MICYYFLLTLCSHIHQKVTDVYLYVMKHVCTCNLKSFVNYSFIIVMVLLLLLTCKGIYKRLHDHVNQSFEIDENVLHVPLKA